MLAFLTKTQDYKNVSKARKRFSTPFFMLQVKKTDFQQPLRIGITASRRVGNAVVRNKAKRRLRMMIRNISKNRSDLTGADIVIIARTAVTTCQFSLLEDHFLRGLSYFKLDEAG